MSKQTAEVLRAARVLIEQPENWVRGAYALTREGKLCHTQYELACRFCAVGAVLRVATNSGPPIEALQHVIDDSSVTRFNDGVDTTHADVLAAFDRAIAAEEATP